MGQDLSEVRQGGSQEGDLPQPLRHLQAGYVTIPGSQNPDHILENISIFDFELTDDEMQRMAALHTGEHYENW